MLTTDDGSRCRQSETDVVWVYLPCSSSVQLRIDLLSKRAFSRETVRLYLRYINRLMASTAADDAMSALVRSIRRQRPQAVHVTRAPAGDHTHTYTHVVFQRHHEAACAVAAAAQLEGSKPPDGTRSSRQLYTTWRAATPSIMHQSPKAGGRVGWRE